MSERVSTFRCHLAAFALALSGCAHGAETRPRAPCVDLAQSLVPEVRLCALERPAVRLSGHPYHPDSDRVLVGTLAETEGRAALRVESYRVYSVEHVFLTLDLASGRITRDEHRVGGVPDVIESLDDLPEHAARRRAVVEEMRSVVALVEAGGLAGPHTNAPHPELHDVLHFLDAWLAR